MDENNIKFTKKISDIFISENDINNKIIELNLSKYKPCYEYFIPKNFDWNSEYCFLTLLIIDNNLVGHIVSNFFMDSNSIKYENSGENLTIQSVKIIKTQQKKSYCKSLLRSHLN